MSRLLSTVTGWVKRPIEMALGRQRSPEERLLTSQTGNYRPTVISTPAWATASGFGAFSLGVVDEMRKDWQVSQALAFKQAPLFTAEFEFEASSPEVQKYAEETTQRYWQKSLGIALESMPYGYDGSETIWKEEDGRIKFDYLKVLHPRDVRPYTLAGTLSYVKVTRGNAGTLPGTSTEAAGDTVKLEGATPTIPAKGFWATHDAKYNRWYGRPSLMPSWWPWRLRVMPDGAMENAFKAFYKHAFMGAVIRHPDEFYETDDTGTKITSAQDYARQLGEEMKAGANYAMSSRRDDKGNFVWSFERYGGEAVNDFSGLLAYPDWLDKLIVRGIGVPDEILTHDGNTGGFSRSNIAFLAFLILEEEALNHQVELYSEQILLPAVKFNFGEDAWVRLKPKPLLPDPKQQPPTSAPSPGVPGAPPPPPPPPPPGSPAPAGMPAPPPGLNLSLPLDVDSKPHADLDTAERAEIIADVLQHIYGDRAIEFMNRLDGGGGAAVEMSSDGRVYWHESPGEGWTRHEGERHGVYWLPPSGGPRSTAAPSSPAPTTAPAEEPAQETAQKAESRWNDALHPRGPGGKFIRRNSPAALAATTKAVKAELQNPKHTPESMQRLVGLMGLLTVEQLRSVAKRYEIGPGQKSAHTELLDRIASRLSRGRRRNESTDSRGAGGGSTGGINRLVEARPEQTRAKPADPGLVPESLRKHLMVTNADGSTSDHQLVGAAKAIAALDSIGAFLLADGAGAGKTRQMLAVAQTMAGRGKKVLMIAPAGIIKDKKTGGIVGSVGKDAATMGVNIEANFGTWPQPPEAGKVQVATYEQLGKLKGLIDKDTVVIFDEAHGLKNAESARAQFGKEISEKAGSVMYGTATPADQTQNLAYLFRAQIEPPPWQQTVEALNPDKHGAAESLRATSEVFDRLTAAGAMIKREISLDNVEVNFDKVQLSDEAKADLERIKAGASPREQAQMLMKQRFAQERHKIPHAVNAAIEELKQGRQAVIFVAGVSGGGGGSEGGGDGASATPAGPGTAAMLRQALEAAGIPTDHIAELHGGEGGTGKDAVAGFQAGKHKILITTAQSGGTGHNLDDTTGEAPRTQIVVTAPFSAIDNSQMWGRTHRLTTKSKSRMRYLFADTDVDHWNIDLIRKKVDTLGAITAGETLRQSIPTQLSRDDAADRHWDGNVAFYHKIREEIRQRFARG